MPSSRNPGQSGLGPAAPHSLLRGGELAAREARTIRKFINGLTGIGVNEVLTAGQIYYNVPLGRRVLIGQLSIQLTTISDIIQVGLGWTTAVNGAGVFTPVTVQHVLQTGGAIAPNSGQVYEFYPMIMFEYSAGVRCITLRVDANDINATMNLMWSGWWEFE